MCQCLSRNMEWPSGRIPKGGVFNPPKVNYSPETKQFLKLLTDEAKLTSAQRQKWNYFLRNGKPLVEERTAKKNSKIPEVTIRPGSSKRRTREDIVKSGAYVRDRFRPLVPAIDREKAKKHLQDIFAYGADAEPTPRRMIRKQEKKTEKEPQSEFNRFDELVNEIQERKDFLAEMEKIGEASKYRQIIDQQIQARVREMERLKIKK